MRASCLCLLLLVACADASARDARLSNDGTGGADVATPAPRAETRKAVPAVRDGTHDARVRPSVHGDLGNAPRTRWHSFLPGMFR